MLKAKRVRVNFRAVLQRGGGGMYEKCKISSKNALIIFRKKERFSTNENDMNK